MPRSSRAAELGEGVVLEAPADGWLRAFFKVGERRFYEKLLEYLHDGFDLTKRQRNSGRALGFLMAILQKIAASSFAAVRRTLERRLLPWICTCPKSACALASCWRRSQHSARRICASCWTGWERFGSRTPPRRLGHAR